MSPGFLARVRWSNVAIALTVLALLGVLVAWPALDPPAPVVPPAVAEIATPAPTPTAAATATGRPRHRPARPKPHRKVKRLRHRVRRPRVRPSRPVARLVAPPPAPVVTAPPPPRVVAPRVVVAAPHREFREFEH